MDGSITLLVRYFCCFMKLNKLMGLGILFGGMCPGIWASFEKIQVPEKIRRSASMSDLDLAFPP